MLKLWLGLFIIGSSPAWADCVPTVTQDAASYAVSISCTSDMPNSVGMAMVHYHQLVANSKGFSIGSGDIKQDGTNQVFSYKWTARQ